MTTEEKKIPDEPSLTQDETGAPHLLVGLDVYEASDAAIEQAFRLALLVPKTRIDVVWAPPLMAMPFDGSVRPVTDAPALLRERVQKCVDTFGPERLIEAQTEVNLQILDGRPAQAIARAAFMNGADLVIVGAQDKGALEKLFVGSVSRRLVQEAPCPVLVARPRMADAVPAVEAPHPPGHAQRRIGAPHHYHQTTRNVQARENMPLLFPMQP